MYQIGEKVYSESEHPRSIGYVMDVCDTFYKIEFVTLPSETLPFGHRIIEVWPFDDPETAKLTRI